MSDTTAASPWHDLDAYIATPRLTRWPDADERSGA